MESNDGSAQPAHIPKAKVEMRVGGPFEVLHALAEASTIGRGFSPRSSPPNVWRWTFMRSTHAEAVQLFTAYTEVSFIDKGRDGTLMEVVQSYCSPARRRRSGW